MSCAVSTSRPRAETESPGTRSLRQVPEDL
jgi:hypothetical protein